VRRAATARVYVDDGIASKILPALEPGRLVDVFRDKAALFD
jgi:glucokinase